MPAFDGITYPKLRVLISLAGAATSDPQAGFLRLGQGPGLDTGQLAGPVWTDIGADVQSWRIRRGQASEIDSTQPAEASFVVRDTTGNYDPLNPASPYNIANLLGRQDSDFNGGTGTWIMGGGGTLAAGTVVAEGTGSLKLTADGSGGMYAYTTAPQSVSLGQTVTVGILVKKATTGSRGWRVVARWLNADEATSYNSQTNGATVTADAAGWYQLQASGTSPVNGYVVVQFESTTVPAAGEVWYADQAQLAFTATLPTWIPGGTVGLDIGRPVWILADYAAGAATTQATTYAAYDKLVGYFIDTNEYQQLTNGTVPADRYAWICVHWNVGSTVVGQIRAVHPKAKLLAYQDLGGMIKGPHTNSKPTTLVSFEEAVSHGTGADSWFLHRPTVNISSSTNVTPPVFTTAAVHGLVVGDKADIVGHSISAYNGTWEVNSVPTTTTATFKNATTGALMAAGGAGAATGTIAKIIRFDDFTYLHAAHVGRSSWRTQATSHFASIKADGFDGVFLDDTNTHPGHGFDEGTAGVSTEFATNNAYRDAVNAALAVITPAARAQGLLVVPNVGMNPWTTDQYAGYTTMLTNDYLDGVFREFWVNFPSAALMVGDEWAKTMQVMLDAEAAGKAMLANAYPLSPTADDTASIRYGLASFWLHTSSTLASGFGYNDGRPSSLIGTYRNLLGTPTEARQLISGTSTDGAWMRHFTGGVAICNAKTTAGLVTFSLGGTYTDPSGTSVTSVQLDQRQGMVLLAPTDTPTASEEPISYPLFYGAVVAINPDHGRYGRNPTVTFTCQDGLEQLGRATVGAIGANYDGDLTGTRIGRILDAAGWPTSQRAIDAGYSTCQATTLGDNALPLLQAVADTELGRLFIDPSGTLTFYDRLRVYFAARSTTVQAVLADTGTDISPTTLTFTKDGSLLFTQARITRDGGTEQVVTDPVNAQPGAYGVRTYPGSVGTLLRSDSDAYSMAGWLVSKFKNPQVRVEQVQVNGLRGRWPTLLSLRPLDRIRVIRQGGAVAIDRQEWIEGMELEASVSPARWDWTIYTSDAYAFQPLLLDQAPGLGTAQLA